MDIVQDTGKANDSLDTPGAWIYLCCNDAPDGASISAERTNEHVVSIMTLDVAPALQKQGRGRALVESLFTHIPSDVRSVVLKGNDNPGFWNYAKASFKGVERLSLPALHQLDKLKEDHAPEKRPQTTNADFDFQQRLKPPER
jgi:GNAT superfamily N-acetyltransferase